MRHLGFIVEVGPAEGCLGQGGGWEEKAEMKVVAQVCGLGTCKTDGAI